MIYVGIDIAKLNHFASAISSDGEELINQRNGQCACLLGVDIGAYDTCGHLCRYCYANADTALVKENMMRHDPMSPFLLGGSMQGDVIHEAKQKSWVDGQMRLDLF